MNVPGWKLDWFADRLVEAGVHRREVARMSRRELRGLYAAYMVGLVGKQWKARGIIKVAGEHGELAHRLGMECRP